MDYSQFVSVSTVWVADNVTRLLTAGTLEAAGIRIPYSQVDLAALDSTG